MLQFKITEELKSVLTSNGIPLGLPIDQKITIIHYIERTTLTNWFYNSKMFIGDYDQIQNVVKNNLFVDIDQIPLKVKINLYNTDGTDKYILPQSTAENYGKPTEMIGYPLLIEMQVLFPLLKDNIENGGYK